MASPQQQRYTLEDPGVPHTHARREARRYSRRTQSQSPETVDDDDDLYSGHGHGHGRGRGRGHGESRSPTFSDVALQDAAAAVAQAHHQPQPQPQQVGHCYSAKHFAIPLFPSLTYVQQRIVPPANHHSARRGPQPLPPSYPGPKGLDSSPRSFASGDRTSSTRQSPSRPEPESRGNMQNRTSQPIASDGSRQQQQQQQRYPPSARGLAVPGADINRVNSPSIQMIVLQPLERKIDEYDHLMREEQANMDHFDHELRILEERRHQAEERFLEAKAKHDEYERQHQDVSKALQS
ncbi:hypothetical protein AK830_g4700 [Neonectria ditissima]|uniref:Uncharacterized protein n=1 Tax=Neonectria ditissima TaxID=78410 RepID=A0A0N8H7I4_9HYPO|nr:hypothetical protein AK830_g4700 [Neonectria ditissima]